MNKIKKNNYITDDKNAIGIISIILNFLAIFMPMTLAKRVVGIQPGFSEVITIKSRESA